MPFFTFGIEYLLCDWVQYWLLPVLHRLFRCSYGKLTIARNSMLCSVKSGPSVTF